jgi:hypothetical protein
MATIERQTAIDIDARTFKATVNPFQLSSGPAERIRRGDTIIVRDVIPNADGTITLKLVTEDALREVATRLLVP